jgi:hypothetical protein
MSFKPVTFLASLLVGVSGCTPQPRFVGTCGVKDYPTIGSERITAHTKDGLKKACQQMFIFSSFRNEPLILQIGTDTIEIPPSTLDVRS